MFRSGSVGCCLSEEYTLFMAPTTKRNMYFCCQNFNIQVLMATDWLIPLINCNNIYCAYHRPNLAENFQLCKTISFSRACCD